MRYIIVEFFAEGLSPEVVLVSDMDGFPIVFGTKQEAEDWAVEGNCGTYQIIGF